MKQAHAKHMAQCTPQGGRRHSLLLLKANSSVPAHIAPHLNLCQHQRLQGVVPAVPVQHCLHQSLRRPLLVHCAHCLRQLGHCSSFAPNIHWLLQLSQPWWCSSALQCAKGERGAGPGQPGVPHMLQPGLSIPSAATPRCLSSGRPALPSTCPASPQPTCSKGHVP